MKPVAITSFAAFTPFGSHLVTWERLLRGHHIDDHARLNGVSSPGRALKIAHDVAVAATSSCPFDADAAIIVGTSKGGVEDWFHPPVMDQTSDNPKGCLSVQGLGDIAGSLSARFRTRGPVLTLSAACASGLHALIRAAMMIRTGEVRKALVVASEASIQPMFLGSFKRLGVLAEPGAGCRPFDQNRTGFYLSEAACAVMLQAADGRGFDDSIFIDRIAMAGDATHLTGGDPEGRVLRHVLRQVIDERPVDLIHAHGTATQLNDPTELSAIETTVGNDWPQCPVVYSHKAALGHSLGAAGLLSVVLNCQSHTSGVIPPNVRTTAPLLTRGVVISRAAMERCVRRSLAIAAGFGGPVAAVSLASRNCLKDPEKQA